MAARFVLIVCLLLAGKCHGQNYNGENSLDADSEIEFLRRNLTALWQKIQAGGQCSKPNVHIHVHGETSRDDSGTGPSDPTDPHHGNRRPDDTHVHLHLNVDNGLHPLGSPISRDFNSSEEFEEHFGHAVEGIVDMVVDGPFPHHQDGRPVSHDLDDPFVDFDAMRSLNDDHEGGETHEYLDEVGDDRYVYGTCHVRINAEMPKQMRRGWSLNGCVRFRQAKSGGPVRILVDISGFKTNRFSCRGHASNRHGMHIHQLGDLSQGCNSLGGHYNPHGSTHQGPGEGGHPGDLGNIECNAAGRVSMNMTAEGVDLFGAHSIIGRSIVIHNGPDDLGQGGTEASRASGSAGPRVGCCVIGQATADNWNMEMSPGRWSRRHN